jgi:hypothetical protein
VPLCPCQGYILYSLRKKLKAELVGRSQEEIKELRLAGQEVTDTYQVIIMSHEPAANDACSTKHRQLACDYCSCLSRCAWTWMGVSSCVGVHAPQ